MDSNTRKRRYYGLGWGGKNKKRCEIYTPVVLSGKNYDRRREERKREQKVLDLKRKELDVSRKELEAKRRELELKKIELDVKQKELEWKQTELDLKQKELEFEKQKEDDEMDNDGLRSPRLQRTGGALDAAANFSGDHLPDRAVSYSPQEAKPGLVNKVDKVWGPSEISTSQLAQAQRDQSSSSSGIQTGYVGLQSENRCPKATKYMQVLSFGIHNDIAKNIINILKPRILEHPSQTPPSTDYMNKILSCQACGLAIDNVENLLVCDACERGTHLVCLSLFNREEIPEVEWHCCVCLISRNGKLFPPKYGRVTRNKVSANTGVGSLEKVGNQWKVTNMNITANGNPGSVHAVKFDNTGNNLIDPASGRNYSDVREMQEAKISESKTKMDENHIYESKLLPKDTTEVLCVPPLSGQSKDATFPSGMSEVVGQPCTP